MGIPAVTIDGGRVYFNTRDEGIREQVLRYISDVGAFMREVLGGIFYYEFTNQHRAVLGVLGDSSYPYVAVCSWRNFGKTSLLMGYIIHQVLFRRRRFVVYLGASYRDVVMRTEDIKLELMVNKWVREVFGELVPGKVESGGVVKRYDFSKSLYYLGDGVSGEPFAVICPRGVGQSIRGSSVRVGGRRIRPDLVVVDDLESDEMLGSEVEVEKVWRWFNSTIKYLVDIHRPVLDEHGMYRWEGRSWWRFIVMDTMKHANSLIGRLLQDRSWCSLVLPRAEFRDGEWYSCVPELVSDEVVRAEIAAERENGTFELYSREMLCQAGDISSERFSRDMFVYFSGDDWAGKYVRRYLVVDPARSISNRSSYTGLLVFGVNLYEGKVYLIDYVYNRLSIDELRSVLVDYSKRYRVECWCIEDIGLRDWIRNWVEGIVVDSGLPVRIMWLNVGHIKNRALFSSSKEARLATMLPLYRSRSVYHNEAFRDGVLERQLLQYPNIRFWDLMDCVGYVPYILDREGLNLSNSRRYTKEELMVIDSKIRSGVWRIV